MRARLGKERAGTKKPAEPRVGERPSGGCEWQKGRRLLGSKFVPKTGAQFDQPLKARQWGNHIAKAKGQDTQSQRNVEGGTGPGKGDMVLGQHQRDRNTSYRGRGKTSQNTIISKPRHVIELGS